MFPEIHQHILSFHSDQIKEERKSVLLPLAAYIKNKKENNQPIRLNFICTHNSRRSHLSQIWAQTMAHHFGIPHVSCYSGGTEATAVYPMVVETLIAQGFRIQMLSSHDNPVYAIKFDENEAAVVCFSKCFDHAFNPTTGFAAIMTCNSADEACPIVNGAEARFPIKYDDPKAYDGTEQQTAKYAERSLEIAREMWWVFSQI